MENTTRMEGHYAAIQRLLESKQKYIYRVLYTREIRTLRRRFPQVKIEIDSLYRGPLYNCVIRKIK